MEKYQAEAEKYREVKAKWDDFHKEHDPGERALSKYNGNNRLAGESYNSSRIEAARKEKKLGKEGLQHAVELHRGTRELPKENAKGKGGL